jgi:hypothetical protein
MKSLISVFDFRKKTTAELDSKNGIDKTRQLPCSRANPRRCGS